MKINLSQIKRLEFKNRIDKAIRNIPPNEKLIGLFFHGPCPTDYPWQCKGSKVEVRFTNSAEGLEYHNYIVYANPGKNERTT